MKYPTKLVLQTSLFIRTKNKPTFIIEIKKDSTPEQAFKQIKEKRYPLVLKDYTGQKLVVGIIYDSKQKQHKVKIEDIN